MSYFRTTLRKLRHFDFQPFIPKTFVCLKEGYTQDFLKNDLIAGITVGIIALPLAMAFAIGAGVSPERGLYTAIVAGFLIALLGGSRVQVSGPTGAFIVVIYATVQRHGYDGLAVATLLAAIILITLGFLKCGTLVRFIPYPVTVGFTTGIATVIFFTQIKDFCGLSIPGPKVDFFGRLSQYLEFGSTFNTSTFFISSLTIGIILGLRRISRNIPGAIIAIIVASLITIIFNLPCDTIESKFGKIPNSLPLPSFPHFTMDTIRAVFPDAITIALLGAIESLLSCVVADGMTGFRHKSNLELIAQGIGNIGSVIFGGIPATGAIARTTASIQMQAKTPFASMFHAITLFILMIFFAPLAAKIPLGTMAAILIVIAYNMSEYEHFIEIIKGPRSDALILIATYLITVIIDLTVAVQVGVLLAAFLFLKQMTEKSTIKICKILKEESDPEVLHKKSPSPFWKTPTPPGCEIFEIEGPFFFGIADILNETLRLQQVKPQVFILRMRSVPLVDGSGIQALKQFHTKCKNMGITFLLTEVRSDVMRILEKGNVVHTIGSRHFFDNLEDAVNSLNLSP